MMPLLCAKVGTCPMKNSGWHLQSENTKYHRIGHFLPLLSVLLLLVLLLLNSHSQVLVTQWILIIIIIIIAIFVTH